MEVAAPVTSHLGRVSGVEALRVALRASGTCRAWRDQLVAAELVGRVLGNWDAARRLVTSTRYTVTGEQMVRAGGVGDLPGNVRRGLLCPAVRCGHGGIVADLVRDPADWDGVGGAAVRDACQRGHVEVACIVARRTGTTWHDVGRDRLLSVTDGLPTGRLAAVVELVDLLGCPPDDTVAVLLERPSRCLVPRLIELWGHDRLRVRTLSATFNRLVRDGDVADMWRLVGAAPVFGRQDALSALPGACDREYDDMIRWLVGEYELTRHDVAPLVFGRRDQAAAPMQWIDHHFVDPRRVWTNAALGGLAILFCAAGWKPLRRRAWTELLVLAAVVVYLGSLMLLLGARFDPAFRDLTGHVGNLLGAVDA